jgi:hypothetical protein
MRAYSSGVTFVPTDFVRRDAMRRLLAAPDVCAPPTRGYRRFLYGNRTAPFHKSRTFRAVPIEEPRFPCSNPVRGDVSPVTAGAQHRIGRSHHRAASASSSSRDSESAGSCSDSDTASMARSVFVMCSARKSDDATTGFEGDGDDTRPDAGPRVARHSCASSTNFGLKRRLRSDSGISPNPSSRDTVSL